MIKYSNHKSKVDQNLIKENEKVVNKLTSNKSEEIDNKLKFIDLFAGTGAFTLALEKNSKFKCVFSNDMMLYKKIYELNNPNHNFLLQI